MNSSTNMKGDILLLADNDRGLSQNIASINRQKQEFIAKKWLMAIENNKVEDILPATKEELDFFEIWWYNFALVKKLLLTNENNNAPKSQAMLGYYNEPFLAENWFIQQIQLIEQKKLNKYQVFAIKDIQNRMQNAVTVDSTTSQKWLQALANNTIKEILPQTKSKLGLGDCWWYYYSLAYTCYLQTKKPLINSKIIIRDYYGDDVKIGTWLRTQIKAGLNKSLFNEQITALKGIDITIDENHSTYLTVIRYHNCMRWIQAVKNNSVMEILPPKVEEILIQERWCYKYAVAYKYFKKFENLDLVETKDVVGYYGETVHLGSWIHEQRQNRRQNKLFPEQIQALDDIKMIWKKGLTTKDLWQLNLEEVKKYKEQNHTLAIPKDYHVTTDGGVSLAPGYWLRNQRNRHNVIGLSDDKASKLNELETDWDINEVQWQENYQDAVRYFEEHHYLYVVAKLEIQKDPAKKRLWNWLNRQKKDRVKGNLTPEKINLLDKIGMIWDREENHFNNVLLFEHYGLSAYVNREILDTRSTLIMNAMICYCKDNGLPLTIENKLNPIIINGILPSTENESIKLEDVMEKYQNRLNLVRRTR